MDVPLLKVAAAAAGLSTTFSSSSAPMARHSREGSQARRHVHRDIVGRATCRHGPCGGYSRRPLVIIMIQWRHDCPDTHELVAFAVGYQIELGDGARSFVHELATELAYKQSAGSDEPTDAAIRRATRCIMQRIGCCIMRSNAAIIETGQNKGGAVPGHRRCVTQLCRAANSVKHSSWRRSPRTTVHAMCCLDTRTEAGTQCECVVCRSV